MITLYELAVSPFCDKIRRILVAKDLSFREEKVPALELGAYRKINPTGKVPCIVHDGTTVADSTAIAYYLEERFPAPALVPSDPTERGMCHVLEDWADESLYFYQKRLKYTVPANAARWMPRFFANDTAFGAWLGQRVLPRRQQRQLHQQGLGRKTVDAIVDDIARHAASIAALVTAREWLVGDRLSLADIAVFAQLDSIRATPEGAPPVERHPTLLAWMDRVDAATRPRQARTEATG